MKNCEAGSGWETLVACADAVTPVLFPSAPQVCSVAVAEEYQAAEEASRKKSQADNRQSSERLSAPWPGTVPRRRLVFVTSGLPCVEKRYPSALPRSISARTA